MAIPAKDVPNSGLHEGDRGGSFPQGKTANSMPPTPNKGMGGDRRSGSFPLTESHGVIHAPNQSPPAPGHSGGQG